MEGDLRSSSSDEISDESSNHVNVSPATPNNLHLHSNSKTEADH
jgi:hypothetical protein